MRRLRLAAIVARLRVLRRRRGELDEVAPALRVVRTGVATPLATLDTEKNALEAERRALRASKPRGQDAIVQARLDALSVAVRPPLLDPAKLNLALRALLARVVVDWQRNSLTLQWKHGGQSVVSYDPNALRRRRQPIRQPRTGTG